MLKGKLTTNYSKSLSLNVQNKTFKISPLSPSTQLDTVVNQTCTSYQSILKVFTWADNVTNEHDPSTHQTKQRYISSLQG
jgi:hypothetical protein